MLNDCFVYKTSEVVSLFSNIIIPTLLQITIFMGAIIFIGIISALIVNFFYLGIRYNKKIIYSMGIIGIPLHEISHALFAMVFRHKIKSIKLFSIKENQMFGEVRISFNRRNPYQLIGRFFVGIAPVIVGVHLVILMINIFIPSLFGYMQSFSSYDVSIIMHLNTYAYTVIQAFLHINFTIINILILMFSLSIVMYVSMSKKDIIISLKGLPIIAFSLLIINSILYLFSESLPIDIMINIYEWSIHFVSIYLALMGILVILCIIITLIYRIFTLIF